jgi:hypothetical protein
VAAEGPERPCSERVILTGVLCEDEDVCRDRCCSDVDRQACIPHPLGETSSHSPQSTLLLETKQEPDVISEGEYNNLEQELARVRDASVSAAWATYHEALAHLRARLRQSSPHEENTPVQTEATSPARNNVSPQHGQNESDSSMPPSSSSQPSRVAELLLSIRPPCVMRASLSADSREESVECAQSASNHEGVISIEDSPSLDADAVLEWQAADKDDSCADMAGLVSDTVAKCPEPDEPCPSSDDLPTPLTLRARPASPISRVGCPRLRRSLSQPILPQPEPEPSSMAAADALNSWRDARATSSSAKERSDSFAGPTRKKQSAVCGGDLLAGSAHIDGDVENQPRTAQGEDDLHRELLGLTTPQLRARMRQFGLKAGVKSHMFKKLFEVERELRQRQRQVDLESRAPGGIQATGTGKRAASDKPKASKRTRTTQSASQPTTTDIQPADTGRGAPNRTVSPDHVQGAIRRMLEEDAVLREKVVCFEALDLRFWKERVRTILGRPVSGALVAEGLDALCIHFVQPWREGEPHGQGEEYV